MTSAISINARRTLAKLISNFVLISKCRRSFRSYLFYFFRLNSQYTRIKRIKELFDIKTQTCLEIGPLHCPTFKKNLNNIYYADILDRDGLIEQYKDDNFVKSENIPFINYVINPLEPSKTIDKQFDFIIANHVIEHIPNIILYLNDLEKILNTNGRLFLTVPDKRKTFDKNRELTTFEHILNDFNNGSFYNDREHLIEWNIKYNNLSEEYVMQNIDSIIANMGDCEHIHYHVFTSESFKKIIDKIISEKLINFDLIYFEENYEGYEFFCCLQRR